MPVNGQNKDPWWAVPATIAVIGLVGAPVIMGVIWLVVKLWISITHMTGC